MELLTTGITFFQKGGIVMYVLLLCSLFVLSIGIERALYFRRMDSGRAFARDFYLALANGKRQQAEKLADDARGALADILFAVITKKPEASKNPATYMEVQSGIALAKLRKRLYYLSVIVTMAPLLGTISGMITSFSVFNLESGQATAITGGVGEALIATAMGLCVAIVSLAVHAYFSQRIENIVTDMEQCFSMVETADDESKEEAA
ncbi:MotA/TolQ/ExbB proton channel family protein [Mitsuokella multacida]|uniref:MotA/TolQ/ExbB proton channel family protein n=1 Tax=Mitsuokella multacida TaxID=52226 RepID=UPI00242D75D8|nr:MotA/TolQ/ExbB proton channel family protein [Mitsuokella multacida]